MSCARWYYYKKKLMTINVNITLNSKYQWKKLKIQCEYCKVTILQNVIQQLWMQILHDWQKNQWKN
jgi:hypothetical protein